MNNSKQSSLDFSNTEIAFKAKSDADLRNSYMLFKALGLNWLVQIGPAFVNAAFAIYLPIKGIIKATVYKQFCGGESIEDCVKTVNTLHSFGIGTILDYSVEGKEAEADFEHTTNETIKTIANAQNNPKVPFSVFKVTGLARLDLLNKVNEGKTLTSAEGDEFARVKERVNRICKTAFDKNVRLFIDAEETWIQNAIDNMVDEMMETYNKNEVIVFNTLQFYRHDRLAFLKQSHQRAIDKNYYLGIKLVRGAYMEKERERAQQFNYADPIQPNKSASDEDYNEALQFCVKHIDRIAICSGTHNEESCVALVKIMDENGINKNDSRIYFSQLFGMSDNLSYNLANAGYNVAKYLPYGPVKSVLPYLFRRAQENTSAKGQAGRELSLILKEMKRRRLK
ncbi:MAG: proline dehydrogenase family protein [Bacteroidetes bacterium]|nr:proline dehydrogenase family protein [Bacteroidota bacterium]